MKKPRKKHPKNCTLIGNCYHFRMLHKGQSYKRSLKTNDYDTATVKAIALKAEVLNGTWEQREREVKGKSTIGDLFAAWDHYTSGVRISDRYPKECKTIASKLIRHSFPGRNPEEINIDNAFHPDTFKNWSRHKIQSIRAAMKDPNFKPPPGQKDPLHHTENAIATDFSHMKALFGKTAREDHAYEELLYDKATIEAARRIKAKAPPPKVFVEPSAEATERLKDALQDLLSDPNDIKKLSQWFALQLAANVGLRRKDACYAKWEFFQVNHQPITLSDGAIAHHETVRYIWEGSTDKSTKGGTDTIANVHPDVYHALLSKQCSLPYIIPGSSYTARFNAFRRNAKLLRECGIDATRPNHHLRKWLGATLATNHGIYTAQTNLGHKDPKLTSSTYATHLSAGKASQVL